MSSEALASSPSMSMEKPKPIRIALLLLWISFGISAAESLGESFEAWDTTMWAFLIFMCGIWAWVIVAISRQRNWARLVALVSVVATAALCLAWPEVWPERWPEVITTVASLSVEAAALYLLFTGGGAAWFRARTA